MIKYCPFFQIAGNFLKTLTGDKTKKKYNIPLFSSFIGSIYFQSNVTIAAFIRDIYQGGQIMQSIWPLRSENHLLGGNSLQM